MAQPKGYAAFILFPHLKMIPRFQAGKALLSVNKIPFEDRPY